MLYVLVFINFIDSLALNLSIIYLIVEVAVAFGTILLAIMAYKQIKESTIARKRVVALDLASIIACVLAYIKDCYNLKNDLVDEFDLELCIEKPISLLVVDTTPTMYYSISYRFYRLERIIRNLALSLADKSVERKLRDLPEFNLIYIDSLEECKKVRESNIPEHVSKSFNVLTSILKHLIKEYSLSISEIKSRCQGLLNLL